MGKPLDVPWDKIKEVAEKGTPLVDVAKLFGISKDSVRMRSQRENWSTPKRIQQRLNKAAEVQSNRVKANQSLSRQIMAAESGQISPATASVVDIDQATKDYRNKGIAKLAMLLDQTIVAPPRNWKDMDIADKMMRRLLGIDDNEGKTNTIVSLQLVNDRLMASGQDAVLEGDFIEESVIDPSSIEPDQSNLTGTQSASTESDCNTSPEGEMLSV